MYLFFDTETTGLPKKWTAPASDVENWPRVIQLGFILIDENLQIIQEYSEFVKPNGFKIPETPFHLEHGLTNDRCNEFGLPIEQVVDDFIAALNQCKYLIAHNMKYDHPIMAAEMIRQRKNASTRPEKICTMMTAQAHYGGKWPKLENLYEQYFGCKFDGAHDALNDVRATKDVFFKMMDLQIINL